MLMKPVVLRNHGYIFCLDNSLDYDKIKVTEKRKFGGESPQTMRNGLHHSNSIG